MRNSILVNGLILVSMLAAPSCVYGVEDDEAALGSTTHSELSTAGDLGDGSDTAETDRVDEACELTTRLFDDHTDYWIRNCYDYEIGRQVVAEYDGQLYVGEYHSIAVGLTVSGSVRGRVLRLRKR